MGAPEGFGYKIAWLAIRTENTQAVADALGMTEVRPASWAEGVEAAYDARREPQAVGFPTPPVDGWTLAVLGGGDLFDDNGTGGGALDLAALSRRFGEAQKFSTHRVVERHEWQRWAGGPSAGTAPRTARETSTPMRAPPPGQKETSRTLPTWAPTTGRTSTLPPRAQ